jgi:SAM-dependent methyltransferase
MDADHHIFDRRLLTRRRDRVAAGVHRYEFLLARVADDLLERLAAIQRAFPVALDLGAHHGLIGRRLRGLPGIQMVIEAEASWSLLQHSSGARVQVDEELLPFADASLDLVISGLALQHVNDLPGTLVQIRRALRPDGLLLASLLGAGSLFELRRALLRAEEEVEGGASPRVAPFADVRDLGGLLQRAQFALPVADADTVVVTYPDALALMRDLRGMGATNVLRARSRRPLRRATLRRAMEIYGEEFGTSDGRIPATFEIVTLTGWAPHASQQQPLKPGSAKVRLADALGSVEQSAGVKAGPDRGQR